MIDLKLKVQGIKNPVLNEHGLQIRANVGIAITILNPILCIFRCCGWRDANNGIKFLN